MRDSLQPEWANLRFFTPTGPDVWNDAGSRISNTRFLATGPSSRPIHFAMPKSRMWGIGFLPLGWARFIHQPAAVHANLICSGYDHPSFAPFAPLADSLFADQDEAQQRDRIMNFFRNFKARPMIDEKRIQSIHAALIDPELATVHELVERVAASQRTVERLCHRHFGFSPKLLLRRQRFMRSLAQFMLDPSLKWIGAMDGHYHDQAQFVRDFREFMGTTPSEYAASPHPILNHFMHERFRIHGAAVQTMDQPAGSTQPVA